jgi:DNA mismatch repair protein MutS2
MQDQAFDILEYDDLRALIRRGTQTPMGHERTDALRPIENLDLLRKELARVAECVYLRARGGVWSFSLSTDPAENLALLRVEGAVLEPAAMLEIKSLSDQAMSARASILAEREATPELWSLVHELPVELSRLSARIANKILPTGELDDRASPELAKIRHEITTLRSRLTRTLEGLMRKAGEAIQDELVTIRNDRFVIPVKADHRARVNGVAHGFSSSGATAFVEPLETIEANNELQSLHEAESREIYKILFGLSEELRTRLSALHLAAVAIAELDFINAKSVFHQRFDCVIPEVGASADDSMTGFFELVEARHPLLEENLRPSGSVVPVSLSLNNQNNAMIISGANAGGKTVVLKTAGLLTLMALSGISVPARSARIPFYSSVLADIGDHQSLAANLSTFTSHVANIARMIEICEAPALVLLDEVGTGTDPEEGSALGVAVVDHFRRVCGAQVIATTHYSGLKMYAANEPGVLNASVEFDEKTLRPTYRLLVGLAGSSSGLEIARRFGIPGRVIDLALDAVKDSSRQSAEYLQRIKHDSEAAANLRAALEEERIAVAEKYASLEKSAAQQERARLTAFQRELDRAVNEVQKKSGEVLAAIRDRAERLKVEREAQRRVAELKRETHRALVSGAKSNSALKESSTAPILVKKNANDERRVQESEWRHVPSREIVVGDKVRLRTFGSIGIVDSLKCDEAEVRVKSLRFKEKLVNLELVEVIEPPKNTSEKFASLRPTSDVQVKTAPAGNGQSEINVIGQTTDEAVDAVDKFLDEATIASLSQVRIVHGHGTGALRRAIADLLKGHPHVAKFTAAPQDQGGTGATIVELRQ